MYVLGIVVVMKKNSIKIQPPKRSSSLVTRFTRPIFEQQSQKTLSTSSSFSSSILMRGMSERITPTPPSQSQKSANHSLKSARRRAMDVPRQSTATHIHKERSTTKENLSRRRHEPLVDEIYQFPNYSSSNKVEIHIPPSEQLIPTKKYYFHSNPIRAKEDLLNNSYGLTLLHQQARHSNTTTALMISQVPNQVSSRRPSRTSRTSDKLQQQQQLLLQQAQYTQESLDDLLCDREVESYFYPISDPSERIYANMENLSSLPISSVHGTLC